jgi:hypothetical protein
LVSLSQILPVFIFICPTFIIDKLVQKLYLSRSNKKWDAPQDIDTWWVDFQKIYDSSIREIEAKTIQLLFLKLSRTNILIEYLFQTLINLPDTRFPVEDEKDLMYPNHCCYIFFRDNYIEKNWQLWLLAKATVRYYHTIFAPALYEKTNSREIRRLSNRFPEYANAVRWLAKFNEYLHSNYDKKNVERFFHAQSIEQQTEARISKRSIGQLASLNFYQCRVCGAMCIPTPALKLLEKGAGKGKSKKICSAPECEKAWELLRKSLPPIPNDEKGGLILLSHL